MGIGAFGIEHKSFSGFPPLILFLYFLSFYVRIYFIPQDIEHLRQNLYIPDIDEYIGGEKKKNER